MKHIAKFPLFGLPARALATLALVPALISLTLPGTAQAQRTNTWTGGSGSPYWFGAANWSASSPQDFDDLVFTGTTRLNHLSYANMDATSPNDFIINSITFDATAGAFVISDGGPARSIIKLQGDITNSSANLQTLNFNFQLNGGNRLVNTTAGDIAIGGIISEDSARTLSQVGAGTLTLSNANTHSSTQIGTTNGATAGTVLIKNNTALGIGNLDYGAGGTLELGVDGLAVANYIFVGNRTDTAARTIRLDLGGSNSGELTGNLDIRVDTAGEFVADVGADDTLTFSGNLVTGAGGNAGLTKSGGGTLVLSGTNTYKGPTAVNDGTLVVDGDSSGVAGNFVVASGATLIGGGTIGGDTTIQSGGTLAAGNSPGVLTFVGDLTLDAGSDTITEIDGTTRGTEYDGIDVGGLLTYGGDLSIASDTEIADGVYDLFGIDGTEGGDFASIALSGAFYSDNAFALDSDIWTAVVGSKTYTFSQITGDLTVVPEPGTYALLGGLFALTYVMLRRREA